MGWRPRWPTSSTAAPTSRRSSPGVVAGPRTSPGPSARRVSTGSIGTHGRPREDEVPDHDPDPGVDGGGTAAEVHPWWNRHLCPRSYAGAVSYTHLRAHETGRNLVCRLLLEKKKRQIVH